MKYFLTFDGAPHSPHTERVLGVLARYGIKATFFVEGHRIPGAEPLLRQILEEGHELGNHTYSHEIMTDMNPDETWAEVTLCGEKIFRATGKRPLLLRPPWGKLRPDQSELLEETGGYHIICWNVSVRDWEVTDPAVLAARLLETARPWAVPVMHDEVGVVPQALDLAIPKLLELGYEFSTISEGMLCAPKDDLPK